MATRNNADSVVERIKRHESYYIMTGDIVFLVENHLFRVHRYFFERESPVFREKLALATPPGQAPRGTSDANPFPVDDATTVDFSRFLWVFYNPLYSLYNASVEEWTSILKLASLWRFLEVKKLAVRELEKQQIAAVPKIALYQKYDVDRALLLPAYAALTTRAEPITMAEGLDLGLETCLLLARARELARGSREARASSPVTIEGDEVDGLLKDVFSLKDVPFRPASPSVVRIETAESGASPNGNGNGNGIAGKLFGQGQGASSPGGLGSFSPGQNPKSPSSTSQSGGSAGVEVGASIFRGAADERLPLPAATEAEEGGGGGGDEGSGTDGYGNAQHGHGLGRLDFAHKIHDVTGDDSNGSNVTFHFTKTEEKDKADLIEFGKENDLQARIGDAGKDELARNGSGGDREEGLGGEGKGGEEQASGPTDAGAEEPTPSPVDGAGAADNTAVPSPATETPVAEDAPATPKSASVPEGSQTTPVPVLFTTPASPAGEEDDIDDHGSEHTVAEGTDWESATEGPGDGDGDEEEGVVLRVEDGKGEVEERKEDIEEGKEVLGSGGDDAGSVESLQPEAASDSPVKMDEPSNPSIEEDDPWAIGDTKEAADSVEREVADKDGPTETPLVALSPTSNSVGETDAATAEGAPAADSPQDENTNMSTTEPSVSDTAGAGEQKTVESPPDPVVSPGTADASAPTNSEEPVPVATPDPGSQTSPKEDESTPADGDATGSPAGPANAAETPDPDSQTSPKGDESKPADKDATGSPAGAENVAETLASPEGSKETPVELKESYVGSEDAAEAQGEEGEPLSVKSAVEEENGEQGEGENDGEEGNDEEAEEGGEGAEDGGEGAEEGGEADGPPKGLSKKELKRWKQMKALGGQSQESLQSVQTTEEGAEVKDEGDERPPPDLRGRALTNWNKEHEKKKKEQVKKQEQREKREQKEKKGQKPPGGTDDVESEFTDGGAGSKKNKRNKGKNDKRGDEQDAGKGQRKGNDNPSPASPEDTRSPSKGKNDKRTGDEQDARKGNNNPSSPASPKDIPSSVRNFIKNQGKGGKRNGKS